MLFNPVGFVSAFGADADVCPGLNEIGTAADLPTVDPMPDIRATRDALVERGQGELAESFLPDGMLDLTDRDMTVALSGMQADYDRCAVDVGAAEYGDNSGCDALYDACDARDLLACNDLYWVSSPSSGYERFAATCGERVALTAPGSAGSCDELG